MRTPTRIILSGAAAVAVVGGMGATAYAVTDGTELFKSQETIALEQQNKAEAESLLNDQGAAIDTLGAQISEAEAALIQAQAEYEAAVAAANTPSTTSGAAGSTGSAPTQTYTGSTGGTVQAPAPARQPQYKDDDHENEHEEHDGEEDDD